MKPIRQLEIHLTHRCTLRCSYCYASCTQDKLPPDLSPEQADRAVDFLFAHSGDAPALKIGLWGGEPMLRPDLIERIAKRGNRLARAEGKRLGISLPSNGTLLDEKRIELFQKYRISFSLSLDGGPAAHEDRKGANGQNSWDLIAPGLEVLDKYAHCWRPSVRMTVTPRRAASFHEDLMYLLDRGFRQISFMPASGVGWTRDETRDFDAQLRLAGDDLIGWIRRGIKDLPWYSPVLRRLSALWVQKQTGILPKRTVTCGAGGSLLAVNTLGEIYPCHRFMASRNPPREMCLGTVEEGIINHRLHNDLNAFTPDSKGCRCESCERRIECGRFCIFVNYQQTGRFDKVADEVCFVNDRLGILARHIHDALEDNPHYKEYIEPFVNNDPEERILPLIAAFENKEEQMIEQIGNLIDIE